MRRSLTLQQGTAVFFDAVESSTTPAAQRNMGLLLLWCSSETPAPTAHSNLSQNTVMMQALAAMPLTAGPQTTCGCFA
jgi:hypothetical protein